MKVLLYNLKENLILRQTLNMMNIQCFYIDTKDYNKPLIQLLENNRIEGNNIIDFKEPMIIFDEFSSDQLDSLLSLLRMNGIQIPLKAVITDTNSKWTSLQIHNELMQEHLYMQAKRKGAQ